MPILPSQLLVKSRSQGQHLQDQSHRRQILGACDENFYMLDIQSCVSAWIRLGSPQRTHHPRASLFMGTDARSNS